MQFTLIAYQEANYGRDRCGDSYGHDGSHNLHYSTDEQEIANIWAGYLFKNADDLEEHEYEHEMTLLINGKPFDEYEWGTDEYYDMEEIHDRIKAKAHESIDIHVAEKKRKQEAAAIAKRAREDEQRRQNELARERAERAQYEALRAKFGGQ
jgi:hypothetical protein